MSDCCCTLDCSLVCEDVIDIISLKEPEINTSSLDGVIIAHQTYTGVNTDDIDMNVDNENYTISATINNYATINDLDNIFEAQRSVSS